MGSPDPEDFDGPGHRIQTLPLSPPPPGLRSAPGLLHRSELAMGRVSLPEPMLPRLSNHVRSILLLLLPQPYAVRPTKDVVLKI
jgi:hypothetical protein